MTRRRVAAAVLAGVLTVGLTACASTTDVDPEAVSEPGLEGPETLWEGYPDGVDAHGGISAGAGLADESGALWVVTYGSSANPELPVRVEASGQDVTVRLTEAQGTSTLDLQPTTSVVRLPGTVDLTAPITVTLGTYGAVELTPDSVGTVVWTAPAD